MGEGMSYFDYWRFPDSTTGDGTWQDSYMTVSSKYYYELIEKAKKWDNFMKLLEGKKDE